MNSPNFRQKLEAYLKKEFGALPTSMQTSMPPQGMSSSVFFVTLLDGTECAVKYGSHATKDVPVLDLIAQSKIDIPVPTVIASLVLEKVPVLLLKKIPFPLFETVPVTDILLYLPSIVKNLRKLHTITSATPGSVEGGDETKTWKGILLAIFDGTDFDWPEIATREGLDTDLILNAVERMKQKITATSFDLKEYSLLHTDFNQRNLFVDPSTHEIAAIIDWEEAMFGDPLYDFARIRMYLWHFDMPNEVIQQYYSLLDFTPEQKELEELCWLSRVIQYLAWYSEELNGFNVSRIKLHQEYLRAYDW